MNVVGAQNQCNVCQTSVLDAPMIQNVATVIFVPEAYADAKALARVGGIVKLMSFVSMVFVKRKRCALLMKIADLGHHVLGANANR